MFIYKIRKCVFPNDVQVKNIRSLDYHVVAIPIRSFNSVCCWTMYTSLGDIDQFYPQ